MTESNGAMFWAAQATLCELLGLSFAYPTKELAEAVSAGEWVEAATELMDVFDPSPSVGYGIDSLSGYRGKDPDDVLRLLRIEHTRLYIGPPDPLVSPYEGVWRAADEGVQALLFVNPHSMAVEREMRALGLGRPEGTNEPLDHISTELGFLQYIALYAAGNAKPAAYVQTPEGGWPSTWSTFITGHTSTWFPQFAEKSISETREPFFRVAAGLLKLVVGQ